MIEVPSCPVNGLKVSFDSHREPSETIDLFWPSCPKIPWLVEQNLGHKNELKIINTIIRVSSWPSLDTRKGQQQKWRFTDSSSRKGNGDIMVRSYLYFNSTSFTNPESLTLPVNVFLLWTPAAFHLYHVLSHGYTLNCILGHWSMS